MRKGRPHFVLREFAQSPEGDFPFIIVAHYQHAPLAGPVAGASTRKAHAHGPTNDEVPLSSTNGDHDALAATDLA